jgi:OmpA-OmpF porin, OOP family
MLRTLSYSFLIFSLWALFGRWYYVCHIRDCACCKSDVNTSARISNLRLSKDGEADILRGYEQFNFAEGSTLPDLNENNRTFLDKTANYLKTNPTEILTITACNRTKEDFSIGQKRAEAIREALVKLGADVAQLKVVGCISDDSLTNAVTFNLGDGSSKTITTENKAVVLSPVKPDDELNITISDENFAFNSAYFHPKPAFVERTKQLKEYIAGHPNVSLTIVGHTDNIGNDAYNMRLGQRRAAAVKTFFQQKGIKVTITPSSKGETEPIATNDNDAGRAQNRRVKCEIIK